MTADKKVKDTAEPESAKDHNEETAAVKELKDKPLAKAGKRSAKAVTETEEKEAKENRKAEQSAETSAVDDKKKSTQKPPRSRLARRGKKYKKAAELIDKSKQYTLKEALSLAIKSSTTKFDSSVEIHIRLNVDPKQADQNIRDSVVLPAGTGKNVKVAVYSDDQNVEKAKKAGADIAGSEDFLASLDKGKMDFDVLIATPNVMQKLAKYARVLGPKGLMPNPKSGTVTADVEKAVQQAKAGKVEYRVDSYGIVHSAIGKVSFGEDKLQSNANTILASIKQNKPASLKGSYLISITVTTSMGPGVSVLTSEF